MRTQSIAKSLGLSALALAGLLAGAPGAAESDEYGDGYSSGNFGRVRYIDDGATITRGDWEAATDSGNGVNAPIFPGDAVDTGPDQRAEIQLAESHVVRIDGSTQLTFLALPDPYADVKDNAVLQLSTGQIRLTIAGVQEGEEFRIDTPSGTVYALGDSDLRVEVDPEGRTRVQSFRGVAEVVAEGGSVLVRSGTATEVAQGLRPSDPEQFSTFAIDDFDEWVDSRESMYENRSPVGTSAAAYSSVPSEVRPYYRELDAYGDWSHSDDYGSVWYPASVDSDWRPYYHGSWGYGPSGYFWISNEPWGWAPYHYGRWTWTVRGWGWVPGSVFSGAWVAWSWSPLYVGWSPIDCWDRPVYVSSIHHNYYDSRSWTFVSYRHLGRHDYAHFNVGFDHVGGSLSGAAVVTRPPRVRPSDLSRSAEVRQRAVRTARESQGPPPAARAANQGTGSRPGFLQREHELRGRPANRMTSSSGVTKAPPAPRFPRRLTASSPSARSSAATPRPGVMRDPRPRAADVDHGKTTPAPRPGVFRNPGRRAADVDHGKTTPAPRPGVIRSSRPRAADVDHGETTPTPRPGVFRSSRPRAADVDHGKTTPAPRHEITQPPRPRAAEAGKTTATPGRGFVISRPRTTDRDPGRHGAPSARETVEPAPSRPEGRGGPLHNLYRKMAQPRRIQEQGNPPRSEPSAQIPQGERPMPYRGARRSAGPQDSPQVNRPPADYGARRGGDRPASPPSRPAAKANPSNRGSSPARPQHSAPPPSGRSGNPRHGSGRGR